TMSPGTSSTSRDRGAPQALLAVALAIAPLLTATPAAAQMPALPVLQNGFVDPGWSAGANLGTSDEALVVAAAGAWTPASARYQVSLGAGLIDPKGEGSSGSASGIRVAVPVPTPWTGKPTSALGLTAFAGAGYARFEGSGELHVPVGVGLGWRRRMGETRALSAFVNPFFRWVRRTGDLPEGEGEGEVQRDASLFRTSVGVEAIVTTRLGLTAGYEFGATAEQGVRPGPTGGIFGAGLSYIF
ncbi:MAG TPA: hypothetical protein VFX39_09230, partial [Gemmatimonadaceae bacterium]|nr:hypothetical protein [Gemmatimonadaceae bacterium]